MTKQFARSAKLFDEARKIIPGGVNSPVRAFRAVGGHPLFISHGEGSRVFDVDGNSYVDYVGTYGPLILGHRHPAVAEALHHCVANIGTGFGAPTELESLLAEKIVRTFSSVEMVRLVNSGTESTMSALRLARAFTGRSKIVKFEGCYHGHGDSLLIKAGSGALTLGVPSSPGVPAEIAKETISATFNDLESVQEVFRLAGEQIACVIIEPVAGNMGVVNPNPGFLEGLRKITARYGALLIFDEVMTGYRAVLGGVQNITGIKPDLTCLGKIIGGGLPVGAYGGRKDIMSMISPSGPVYQAGTLSGNPLAVTAGLATLAEMEKPGNYEKILGLTEELAKGMEETAAEAGVEVTVNRFGSMLTCFFTGGPVTNYSEATSANLEHYKSFFWSMLEQGIYLPPSQFEAWFVSVAHGEEEIEKTVSAARQAFRTIAGEK